MRVVQVRFGFCILKTFLLAGTRYHENPRRKAPRPLYECNRANRRVTRSLSTDVWQNTLSVA